MQFFLAICLFAHLLGASLVPTETPPLLDSPTYSMATRNEDGSTNMNILTYATPVSVRPVRVWALGLYKATLSYTNFMRTRSCILQILTEDHIPLVKLLGGTSGRDVDKQNECAKLLQGASWIDANSQLVTDAGVEKVLPNCASYLKLSAIGEIVDAGSHAVAICRVDEMLVAAPINKVRPKKQHLSTGKLRRLGIITEQGRVAE